MGQHDIQVRRFDDDFSHAAALRWRWTVDEMHAESRLNADEFARAFTEWARAHADTHTVFVAFRDSDAVGMTWVALAPRIPSPGSLDRKNAEVMSVYVVPEARGLGIGALLVDAAITWARQAGAEHAIVHSSKAAISLYEGAGFAASPLVLDQDLGQL